MALNCISWTVLYHCQQLTIEENMKGIHWSLMDSTHKGGLVMQSFDGFYPRLVLAFGYCRCLRLSVCVSICVCGNHMLVRAITHHPFELGSPNLDHRWKRPWLRSLLFWEVIELDRQGQIELQSQNLPHFELARAITHHPFKPGSPNWNQSCKIPWLRFLLIWGLIELHLSNLTIFKNPVYLHHFCIFEIFVRPAKTYENGVCSTS